MKAWITSDIDGEICLWFEKKPRKREEYGYWSSKGCEFKAMYINRIDIPEGINPQWSDEEPIEVELKIERVC